MGRVIVDLLVKSLLEAYLKKETLNMARLKPLALKNYGT